MQYPDVGPGLRTACHADNVVADLDRVSDALHAHHRTKIQSLKVGNKRTARAEPATRRNGWEFADKLGICVWSLVAHQVFAYLFLSRLTPSQRR